MAAGFPYPHERVKMRISHMGAVPRLSALFLIFSIATIGNAAAAPKDGQNFGDWIAQCDKEKLAICNLKQTQVDRKSVV